MTIRHRFILNRFTMLSTKQHSSQKPKKYQIHDEIELYGEVNNEEHTGPAVLGV